MIPLLIITVGLAILFVLSIGVPTRLPWHFRWLIPLAIASFLFCLLRSVGMETEGAAAVSGLVLLAMLARTYGRRPRDRR